MMCPFGIEIEEGDGYRTKLSGLGIYDNLFAIRLANCKVCIEGFN